MKKPAFTNEDSAAFCSELQYLLHAGIGNADALGIIAGDEQRPAYKEALTKMAERADLGDPLADILSDSGLFESKVSEMLRAGEKSGKVEEALLAISADCEAGASLDRRLKSALLYPAVLLIIMLAVIAVLLIYVLPVFNRVYAQLGSSLTGIAGGLLRTGEAISAAAPVLIVLLVAVIAFLALFSLSPAFRSGVIRFWGKLRNGKGLSASAQLASFAGALSMCMNSGLPAEEAVSIAAGLISSSDSLSAACGECVEKIAEGAQVSEALRDCGLISASSASLLEAGIRGGSGEQAMEQIAARMVRQSEEAVESAVSRVEPVIVVVTTIIVGIILLTVMMPLINIMSALG